MAEHIKIELADPKVREKVRTIQQAKLGTSIASDDEITKNLNKFARRRTDIFGKEDEVDIGKVLAEEDKPIQKSDKAIWDGHVNSISRTTSAAQGISIEEQIAAIHANKGTENKATTIGPSTEPAPVPTAPNTNTPTPRQPATNAPLHFNASTFTPPRPGFSQTYSPQAFGLPPQQFAQPMPIPNAAMYPPYGSLMRPPPSLEDEPEPKRQKGDSEAALIPEDIFLQQHSLPFIARVQVPPASDKPEWSFHGQLLSFEINPRDTIATLKNKIKDAIGIPVNKQKLKGPQISVMKDQPSLAFYNVTTHTVLELGVKVRGGK